MKLEELIENYWKTEKKAVADAEKDRLASIAALENKAIKGNEPTAFEIAELQEVNKMKKQGSNPPESTIKVKDVYERIIDIYGLYDYEESLDMHIEINRFLDELKKKYERDTNKKI